MRLRALPLAARLMVLMGLGLAPAAPADVIYDVDFDDPGLLGQQLGPFPGGPPDLPSFTRASNGTYTVVASSGDLSSQPLEVVDQNKSQIPSVRFSLSDTTIPVLTSGTALLEFDMLAGDIPGVNDCVTSGQLLLCLKVEMLTDGALELVSILYLGNGELHLSSDSGEDPVYAPLAFQVGVAQHFTVRVNLDGPDPSYTFWVDGQLLGSAGFGTSTVDFDGAAFVGHLLLPINHPLSRHRFAIDDVLLEADPVFAPACSDGLDNDGDLLLDFSADPGCRKATSSAEDPQCDDGVDNDGDGKIDFEGAPPDPECSAAWKQSESPPASGGCGLLGGEVVGLLAPLLAWRRIRRCLR